MGILRARRKCLGSLRSSAPKWLVLIWLSRIVFWCASNFNSTSKVDRNIRDQACKDECPSCAVIRFDEGISVLDNFLHASANILYFIGAMPSLRHDIQPWGGSHGQQGLATAIKRPSARRLLPSEASVDQGCKARVWSGSCHMGWGRGRSVRVHWRVGALERRFDRAVGWNHNYRLKQRGKSAPKKKKGPPGTSHSQYLFIEGDSLGIPIS